MFWNSEFLNASPSHLDVLLQSKDTKLSDILFEEDTLKEIKSSNQTLKNFLIKPEILNELVDTITQLTEEDCCDKQLYSRVHAAYISCEILTCSHELLDALLQHPDSLNKIISSLTRHKVVPQKATLISKLINSIHSGAAAYLSCYITKNLELFSEFIQVLIENIDVSGSFEILSTLTDRTKSPELRYVFCEILSKLKLVDSLINIVTLSNVDDKQRNACQLLCDIIVNGRQMASEQKVNAPLAYDMLSQSIESRETVELILTRIFSRQCNDTDPTYNITAIVCGMKILLTLAEQKLSGNLSNNFLKGTENYASKTMEQIQLEIVKNLKNFHELLLNPPKQEPIKTTFGIIQKPLGYMRLEVVNLIRVLLSTNLPLIIKELVRLKTIKVVIELFIEYSWNNLLHTQVEQALCIIIKNCRHDEDMKYQIEMQKHTTKNIVNHEQIYQENNNSHRICENNNEKDEQIYSLHELFKDTNEKESDDPPVVESPESSTQSDNVTNDNPDQIGKSTKEESKHDETKEEATILDQSVREGNHIEEKSTITEQHDAATMNEESLTTTNTIYETPSRALLSQLLNECDLIGRLLLPGRNGEQANFGHIIQMINSIAINCDLDTISDHLNEMKEKRPELYDRWTTFVNADVASFKEVSHYFDLSKVRRQLDIYEEHLEKEMQQNCYVTSSQNNHKQDPNSLNSSLSKSRLDCEINAKGVNGRSSVGGSDNGSGSGNDDKFFAYLSFTSETVIPKINVDVLPISRRTTKNNNY